MGENLKASNLHGNNTMNYDSIYHGIEDVNNVDTSISRERILWRRTIPRASAPHATTL